METDGSETQTLKYDVTEKAFTSCFHILQHRLESENVVAVQITFVNSSVYASSEEVLRNSCKILNLIRKVVLRENFCLQVSRSK